jgi:hypothetical protein
MMALTVPAAGSKSRGIESGSSSSSRSKELVGIVPNLEHPAFQGIDLWA